MNIVADLFIDHGAVMLVALSVVACVGMRTVSLATERLVRRKPRMRERRQKARAAVAAAAVSK